MRALKPSIVVKKYLSENKEKAKTILADFKQVCNNPANEQEKVLFNILDAEKNTDPGNNTLQKIKSIKDFQKSFPLLEYPDIRERFLNLYEGREKPHEEKPIRYFALSSGTTGKNKILPVTQKYIDNYIINNNRFYSYNLLNDDSFALYKLHNAVGSPAPGYSPSGPASGLLSGFLFHETSADLNDISLSVPKSANPLLTNRIRDLGLQLYAVSSDISCINAVTTYPVYQLFNDVWENWEYLQYLLLLDTKSFIKEMKNRELDTQWIRIIEKNCFFNPGPRRRKIIEELNTGMSKTDFFSRLWEKMSTSFCLTEQSAGYYLNSIKEYYPLIKTLSSNYIATEGMINICMYNDFPAGSGPLCIDTVFFEFIEYGKDENEILLANELEKGKRYEIILTNWNYLFRYKLNDIIEVVDFYGKTPVVIFSEKKGMVLNLFQERTSYEQFKSALNTAFGSRFKNLKNWIVSPGYGDKPHYIFYLDIKTDGENHNQTAEDIDSNICSQNIMYKTYRESGAIGSVELKYLSHENFQNFFKYKMTVQKSDKQFKPIHLLSNNEDIEKLENNNY